MAEAERVPPDDMLEALADCEHQVEHLKQENELLRGAADSFGGLAERLNQALSAERRLGADRRAKPRPAGDRRKTSGAADSALAHAADTPHNGTPIPKIRN